MRRPAFDEKIFLSDLRVTENIISYNSPLMSSRFVKKYDKVYLQ